MSSGNVVDGGSLRYPAGAPGGALGNGAVVGERSGDQPVDHGCVQILVEGEGVAVVLPGTTQ